MSAYVVVADVDAHCARARAAGAEIVMAPADQDYGDRLYTCRDLEGRLWNIGSYDPWGRIGDLRGRHVAIGVAPADRHRVGDVVPLDSVDVVQSCL